MKIVSRLLLAIHIFVGVGGMAGGLAAITDPNQPLGMSIETLKNSPFTNFLIPGILLFVVIGLGNIFSAFLFHFKTKFQGYISSVISWALVIWIIVQCIMLNTVVFLHILFFGIGLVEAAFSFILLFDQRLFPTNVILAVWNKISKQDARSIT